MEKDAKKTGKPVPSKVDGYTEAFGERISAAVSRIGTLGEAGKAAGVSDEQLARWRDGYSKPNIFGIAGLAEAAGVSVSWLVSGEGPMTPPVQTQSQSQVAGREPSNGSFVTDTVEIPRLDIRASAGAGASGSIGDVIEFMPFPLAWLRARGLNPAMMRIVDVAGDSMEPTLSDGDIILVDTSTSRIRGDALYVLVRDDEIFVKRAQQRMNGSVLISSDNERYPPEEIAIDATQRLHVAGRVVWFGRLI